MKHLLTAILAVLFSGNSVFAQFDVGIVLPFENHTRDSNLDWVGESFAQVLSSNLASPRFMMLDRRERAAAFDSLGVPPTSILTYATVYKVAEALDADKLILGSYEYRDGLIQATAQVLDLEGPSLSRKFAESAPLEELMELQEVLAWQILRFVRPAWTVPRDEFLEDRRRPSLEAFENYVRGLLARNRNDQIRYYRTAQRLEPQFGKPAFELGMIYFHDQDYSTSILWLSKLRHGDEDYLEANYFLGLAYLYLEQYERSATAFRAVAQQLPLNEVYNNLGIALMRQALPGAVSYFERAVKSNPTDPDFQFNLGYAYWKRGSYEAAIPHIRAALDEADHPAWRVLYIKCLEKTGQAEQGAVQAKILKQQSPDFSPAMDDRQLEKLERAKDDYDGTSFRQLRLLVRLQTELEHAKLTLGEHVALHFERAQQLLEEGMDREATEELLHVIDYDPDYAEAYRELAGVFLRAEQWEKSSKAAIRFLERRTSAEGYLLLAKIYMEQGKLEEAQEQLDAAVRLEPANPSAAALMEELNSKSVSRQ